MMARSRATERETFLCFSSTIQTPTQACTLHFDHSRAPSQKKKLRGYTNVNSQFVVECVMRGTENGKIKIGKQQRNR